MSEWTYWSGSLGVEVDGGSLGVEGGQRRHACYLVAIDSHSTRMLFRRNRCKRKGAYK